MCSVSNCTDSLQIPSGLSTDTFPTSSDGTYDIGNVKFEDDLGIKEEEVNVKMEDIIGSEEEECIDIKDEEGIHSEEEEEEEDIDSKEEEDVDVKEKSCTDSLQVLPCSSNETHATSSDGACNISNIKVEEDVVVIESFIAINKESDISIKQEEIPEDITFPNIKAEPDAGILNGTFSDQGTKKQQHTVERTYPCGVCNRTFSKTYNLKVHRRLHTGERPYSCDVCNKRFKRFRCLKAHQPVHTGKRPYCCGVCNKTFIRTSSLKEHQRLHTGERPYRCDVCNKTFKQVEHLKLHKRVQTGERPYRCDVCSKMFSRKDVLKRHLLSYCNQHP